MLRRTLKSAAIGLLGTAGVYPTSETDTQEVESLIGKLRPVSGGFDLIRIGPDGDGGYLVPDDLEGIEACFSPGVSDVSGFEEDCANLGMKVFMADASVQQPSISHEAFHFTRKYVGATTSDEFMTMDSWVRSSAVGPDSDLLLQIDIEGFEYETFLNMSIDLMERFRVIVAEFHNLDHYWSRPFFGLATRSFDKILQTHRCVHIHPNNCCGSLRKNGLDIPRVMEFTFLRNDRVKSSFLAEEFPHPLDRDNTANNTLPLPPTWLERGT